MPTQEVFHARVEEEAQEDAARPGQHHYESHQGPPRAPDRQVRERGPVALALLARQCTQAQVGLDSPARTVAGDQAPEVVHAATIAALAHHAVKPGCREIRVFRQRL